MRIFKIKKLFYKITGGRPMEYIDDAFFDPIGCIQVKFFKDKRSGKIWMAANRWGIFRVKPETLNE